MSNHNTLPVDPAEIIKNLRAIENSSTLPASLLQLCSLAATVIETDERIITDLLRNNTLLHIRVEELEAQLRDALPAEAKRMLGLL